MRINSEKLHIDKHNESLFWFCDHQFNANDLWARHMMCDDNRHFDPNRKECVAAVRHATQPTLKSGISSGQKSKMPDDEQFTCTGKGVGKYPDSLNCQLYHFCLPNNFAPLQELLFSCPEGSAYEPEQEKCVADMVKKQQKQQPLEVIMAIVMSSSSSSGGEDVEDEEKTLCKTEKKFCATPTSSTKSHTADIANSCSGYYLCLGNRIEYKKCPKKHRFNQKMLRCEKKLHD